MFVLAPDPPRAPRPRRRVARAASSALCLTALLGLGCERAAPSRPAAPVAATPTPSAPVAPAAQPSAPDAGPTAAPAAEPPITDGMARALLDRWLSAQNNGEFEGYAMLYAPRFYGVKRSGSIARSFQREGWLRDRKRMFAKAMVVAAKDPVVTIGASIATVQFEQDWQSGSYRDVGTKLLVIVREGTELRIAREEMIDSALAAAPEVRAPAPEDFTFVSHEEAPYLVLARGDGGVRARGPVTLIGADHYASARRDVHPADVPAALAPWIGRAVTLYGPSGAVCHGEVVRLALLARVRPHFASVQAWKGEEGATAPSRAAIADDVWDLGQAGLVLAARVAKVTGSDCRAALWARADDRPAPVLATEAAPDPQLIAKGMAAARKTRAWAAVQSAYAEQTSLPRAEHWDSYDDAKPHAHAFDLPDGGRMLWLALMAGAGCGDFYGETFALWAVRGAGAAATLRLLSDDRDPGRVFVPRAAVDLDGDGRFELIGTDALLVPAGATYRIGVSNEVPSLDCPC